MTKIHDVIVVGGGPSGLNLARRLADNNRDVLVLERKKKIGENIVCTGIVGKEIFDKYQLTRDCILRELSDFKIISPYDTFITYEHPSHFACVIDREKFDRELAERAHENGASLELENHVTNIVTNKKYAEVHVKVRNRYLKRFRTRVVVLATGIDHRLSKKLGLGFPRDFLNGIQAEMDVSHVDRPSIFIGRDIAPGAFAWVVPLNDSRIRVGLMTRKDPKIYFQRIIKMLYPDQAQELMESKIQSKAIAHGLVSKTFSERLLVLGEAAGQVKTTTGGGVFFGLLCSELAYQVLEKNFSNCTFSAKNLSEYEALWRMTIQREIHVGYYARKLFERLSDLQIESIFKVAKSDGILPLIQKKGNFDWHGDLIFALMRRMPVRSLQSISLLSNKYSI